MAAVSETCNERLDWLNGWLERLEERLDTLEERLSDTARPVESDDPLNGTEGMG